MNLDSASIDNDHAAQEYMRTVYSVNVPVADRYRLENSYRQQKMHFCALHLSAINDTLETYQLATSMTTQLQMSAPCSKWAFHFHLPHALNPFI
ncbi:hypothetical protein N037_22230 [Enterobacter sp. EGD-HP1]|nr:hypothetical protein N037_22230 [Enterobacter sp. EGD-HP1]